jgi:hypothetical protein
MFSGFIGAAAALRAARGWIAAHWRLAAGVVAALAVFWWRRALRREGVREGRATAAREGAARAAEISEAMRDANSDARGAGGGDVVEWLRDDRRKF